MKKSDKKSAYRRSEFAKGVRVAAAFASEYNGSSTHASRLEDCILGKLNLRDGKPRKNKKQQQRPEDALTRGCGLALSEMFFALGANGPYQSIIDAASAMGIDLAECKRVGLESFDLKRLRSAGLK